MMEAEGIYDTLACNIQNYKYCSLSESEVLVRCCVYRSITFLYNNSVQLISGIHRAFLQSITFII